MEVSGCCIVLSLATELYSNKANLPEFNTNAPNWPESYINDPIQHKCIWNDCKLPNDQNNHVFKWPEPTSKEPVLKDPNKHEFKWHAPTSKEPVLKDPNKHAFNWHEPTSNSSRWYDPINYEFNPIKNVFNWPEPSSKVPEWYDPNANVFTWPEPTSKVPEWYDPKINAFTWPEQTSKVLEWNDTINHVFKWQEQTSNVYEWYDPNANIFRWPKPTRKVFEWNDINNRLLKWPKQTSKEPEWNDPNNNVYRWSPSTDVPRIFKGCIAFIGMLLLIARIETNQEPKTCGNLKEQTAGKQQVKSEVSAEVVKDVAVCTLAASKGDLDTLKRYHDRGIDLSRFDYDKRTPLHLAATEGHADVVAFLLEVCKVPPLFEDRWNGTALSYAREKGHASCERLLMEYSAFDGSTDTQRKEPSWHHTNDSTLGKPTESTNGISIPVSTPGNNEAGLVDQPLDYTDRSMTPLDDTLVAEPLCDTSSDKHLPATFQSPASKLIQSPEARCCPSPNSRKINASRRMQDLRKNSPERLSRLSNEIKKKEIGYLSKAFGKHWGLSCTKLGLSKMKIDEIKRKHPLNTRKQVCAALEHWCRMIDGIPTWDRLLNTLADADFDSIDLEIVESVLDMSPQEITCNEKDLQKEPESIANIALHIHAAYKGDLWTLQRYHERGTDLSRCDYDKRTPLHLAATEGHVDAVSFLLENCKVTPLSRDRWNRTAMDYARENNHDAIEQLLGEYIDRPTNDSLQERPTEIELTTLAPAIGQNWELLGVSLGLRDVEIERIKLDNPYSTKDQIFNMLYAWCKQAGVKATWSVLYRIMVENKKSVTIDWDLVR